MSSSSSSNSTGDDVDDVNVNVDLSLAHLQLNTCADNNNNNNFLKLLYDARESRVKRRKYKDNSDNEDNGNSNNDKLAQLFDRHHDNIKDRQTPYLQILAPMVRYSKLPFRLLCRKWGADVTYTPMIICEAFNRSRSARESEFATSLSNLDSPLIAQFGASDPYEFAASAERCVGIVHAVDLNCGCPQRWAMQSGIGACLSSSPELVRQMVDAVRRTVQGMSVTIKIRLADDLRTTVELVRRAEKAGVSAITVHGRTAKQRKETPNREAIKLVKSVSGVPVFGNGDLFSASDMDSLHSSSGVDGCMTARGALSNPAMFSGLQTCPIEATTDYLIAALAYGERFSIMHHHLLYMMYSSLSKGDRKEFTNIKSPAGIVDFFEERDWLHLCHND